MIFSLLMQVVACVKVFPFPRDYPRGHRDYCAGVARRKETKGNNCIDSRRFFSLIPGPLHRT